MSLSYERGRRAQKAFEELEEGSFIKEKHPDFKV
jgi:hypothetical protein